MDTLPLPPRPSLDQYKKRAKALVAAAGSKDPGAVHEWAVEWLGALARRLDTTMTPFARDSFDRAVREIESRVRAQADRGHVALSEAQFFIARAHGFEHWAAFARHVEQASLSSGTDRDFEAAADAVVQGDLATLRSLLQQNPALIRARSPRMHHATLLHYVAANGFEDFRQRTPPNAVAVARALLEAGAEADALAETYGGGRAQTTLNLLVSSTHPAEVGLHPALVEVLLDFGAAIEGLDHDGAPLMTALAFGYAAPAETLVRRGATVPNVVAAAALGRSDLVRSMVLDRDTLAPGVRQFETRWLRTPREPKPHLEMALGWACRFGHQGTATILLDLGVDPATGDVDAMTPLHWAAANGQLDLIDRLIARAAPLEARNRWGGTVLDSTVYFALHAAPGWPPVAGADYPAVLERLLAAGADVTAVELPTGNPRLDEVLTRLRRLPS